MAILLIHLERLPRPFRARNDIVKIYIAFILVIVQEISSKGALLKEEWRNNSGNKYLK